MSLRAALSFTCDIYHLKSTVVARQFGLSNATEYAYSSTPDSTNVPCYYKDSATMVIADPVNTMSETLELQLLPTTDIRLNDKIIVHGLQGEFIAQNPLNIRNKIKIVKAIRRFKQL